MDPCTFVWAAAFGWATDRERVEELRICDGDDFRRLVKGDWLRGGWGGEGVVWLSLSSEFFLGNNILGREIAIGDCSPMQED